MTYQATPYRSGVALYLTAFASVAAMVLALVFLGSVLLSAMHNPVIRDIGSISVVGLVVAGPVAIVMSLFLRCHACDKLLLPLVYNGKAMFASGGPSAFAIGRTAIGVAVQGHAPCPHCGAEAHV